MSQGDIRTILFIELLGGIGDVIIALPAIHALARSHPSARLTVLTFAPGHTLLEHDPLIHEVIVAPKGFARQQVDQLLNQQCFDLIVSDVSYEGIGELIRASDSPHVVSNLWRSPPSDQLVGDRFLQILLSEGWITPTSILQNQPQITLLASEKVAARQQLGAAFRPLVFLIPDAGMAIKRWPHQNFVTVGRSLQQQYGATILVVAGANRVEAEAIAHAIGGTAQPWHSHSLRQLAAVLAEADLVLAADTGPARIAAALCVSTITLFGPSWHGRYGQPAPHVNLQGYSECGDRNIQNFTEQPCWYSGVCPLDWQTCVEDISPDQAIAAACSLLNSFANSTVAWPNGYEGVAFGLNVMDADKTLLPNAAPLHVLPGVAFGLNVTDSDKTLLPNAAPLHVLPGVAFGLNGRDTANPPSPNAAPPPASLTDPICVHPRSSAFNLLVMRLDNIGDVIMTSAALRSLRENLPNANITLMASPGGAQVAPLLPWVSEVLPHRTLWQDLGKLPFDPQREWALIDTLRQRQFDAAIIFTSFNQSPHPPALICALAGIPIRLGESKEQELGTLTHNVPPAPDKLHQVERNLRLIESVGFQVRDRSLCLHIPNAAKNIVPDFPYLLLNPWTSCQSRNYDAKRFAIAARELSKITGYRVLVTGVEKDRDHAFPLLQILGDRAVNLIGKTTLSELVSLVEKAKLVLTNNTSTMHIADAVRSPSIILFSGTEYECQWAPRHSPTRLLRRPTVCNPCYQFACSYHLECLDIEPDSVVQAGLELLNSMK